MMSSDIKPGWYHSALLYHGHKVRVHVVSEGRVYSAVSRWTACR
jgi:hypothetical protein